MSKRKKHTDADRLHYMHLLESGESINSLYMRYGIKNSLLRTLWSKYQQGGYKAIRKGKNIHVTGAMKEAIVHDIENNHLFLWEASLKYGVSVSALESWVRISRVHGYVGLHQEKKRGRPPGMGRVRKKPLTELEKLQKENLELRTEIALLKKVRALVEERNARLKGTGHKPSKN